MLTGLLRRDLDNWHYEMVQPAKVSNCNGMLTQPAWKTREQIRINHV